MNKSPKDVPQLRDNSQVNDQHQPPEVPTVTLEIPRAFNPSGLLLEANIVLVFEVPSLPLPPFPFQELPFPFLPVTSFRKSTFVFCKRLDPKLVGVTLYQW